MTPAVRFCGACGARVPRNSRTWDADIAYCRAHADLPALDAEPADPYRSLPLMADELTVGAAERDTAHMPSTVAAPTFQRTPPNMLGPETNVPAERYPLPPSGEAPEAPEGKAV